MTATAADPDQLRSDALSGFTVVDLSGGMAGAYASKLLHDAGARIEWVEPTGGDPLLSREPCVDGRSLLFDFLRGGHSTHQRTTPAEDLTTPVDQLDLIARADVLIDSGDADVDLAEIHQTHPELIIVSITPFGRESSWADRPWSSATLQAWSGSTAWRGRGDRPPLLAGGELEQWLAGAYAAAVAIASLNETGPDRGDLIDISILECAVLGLTTFGLTRAAYEGRLGENFPPRTIQIPSIEPTTDGWVGLCTISGQQFRDFMILIGREDLAFDESLAYAAVREQRADELRQAITAWTSANSTEAIVDLAEAFRIPVAPMGNGATIPGFDQVRERGLLIQDGSGQQVPRPPARSTGLHDVTSSDTPPSDLSQRSSDRSGPLAGIRVVDLTGYWAGPSATQLLAMLGADVVKVESHLRPDGMRFSFVPDVDADQWWEWGPIFAAVNTNKRGVSLRLDTEEGLDVLGRLIGAADVLIENFTPRVLDSFGLDRETLAGLNDQLVAVRMPAFGLDGPWRDRPGFAQTIEQASGLAWLTGYPDGPPVVPRGFCDLLAGVNAVFATVQALFERHATAAGRHVEIAMYDVALNVAAEQILEFDHSERLPGRLGNRSRHSAPQGHYPCAEDDSFMAMSVQTDAAWAALCRLIGREHWISDTTMGSAADRWCHHDEIDAAITEWSRDLTVDEAVELLTAAGVDAARVTGAGETAALTPLVEREFFETIDHPVAGPQPLPGPPFRSARHDDEWNRTPAPTLGEHTSIVLSEWLDMTTDEIDDLSAADITGTTLEG